MRGAGRPFRDADAVVGVAEEVPADHGVNDVADGHGCILPDLHRIIDRVLVAFEDDAYASPRGGIGVTRIVLVREDDRRDPNGVQIVLGVGCTTMKVVPRWLT